MPKLLHVTCRLLLAAASSLVLPNSFNVNAQEGDVSLAGKTVVVPLRSDDFKDSRRIREWDVLLETAQKEKAQTVVFDINVKGDLSWDDQEKILESLSQLTIPTIAYVNPSATGTGALIAIGCQDIYMSDSAIIGAAGVRLADSDNEEVQRRLLTKQLSLLKARARNLAKVRGHRADIAEAFVDSEREVKIGEDVISQKGDVLTLTASEAVKVYEGKPLLAKGTASSIEEVLKAENLDGEFTRFSPQQFTRKKNMERIGEMASDEDEKEADKGEEGLFSRRTGKSYRDKIVVIEVGEDALSTGKARFEFMDRTLKKAQLDKAAAVIFDIDTPGGYAWYTQGLLLNSLQNITIPTYAFVNTRAESAGAIIALGTDTIYMRRAATIGSALVVSAAGTNLSSAMESKVTQMMISVVRNIAELKGHNPDIAEAFVTRDKEVVIDGTMIHEKGKVLNLDTIRATEVIGGRPVLAKGVANSIEEIIGKEEIEGELVEAEVLGLEGFAHWIQKLSAILIIIGIAGVYLELQSPGFALPGIVGILAFSLYFFGNYMAGNLAGYELAVLFILGIILIGIEIFLFPGAMIPALVGGVLVIASLGLAMVDRVELGWKWDEMPDAASYTDLFRKGFVNLGIGILGGAVLILALAKFFPKSRVGNLLILNESVPSGASIDGQVAANELTHEAEQVSYLGWEGESTTDLRPAGKGRFNGKLLDIISSGEFIPKESLIVVTKHEGSRIVVKKVPSN